MATRIEIHYADWSDKNAFCGKYWEHAVTDWEEVTCADCLHAKSEADKARKPKPFSYQGFDMLKLSEIKKVFSGDFGDISQTKDIWQKIKDAGVTVYGDSLSGCHKTVRYGDMVRAGFTPEQ